MTNSVDTKRSDFPIGWEVGALFVVSLIWLGLNATTLLRYPTVLPDESLVGLVAFRMTAQGQLPGVSSYDPFGVYPFRLYLVGLAQWFRIWGVGLIQARAFSLLGGFVAGWLMFGLGRALYNARVGLLASIIYWSMPALFWTSHFVRPEIWVGVANIGMFWLAWQIVRSPSAWRIGLLGFLAVAMLDIYLSALSTTFSIGMLCLIAFGSQRKWRWLATFVLGAIVGVVYYGVVQFAPNWQANLAGWQYWLTATGHTGSQVSLIDRMLGVPEALWRYYVRYSVIGWIEAGYFGLTTLWLVRRHTRVDLYVLGAGAMAFGLFGFAFATPWHVLDGLPMAILAGSAGTWAMSEWLAKGLNVQLLGRLPRLTAGHWAALSVTPLLLGHGLLLGYYARANRDYDYASYVEAIQALVPPGGVILGEGTWWFGFTNRPYWWDGELAVANPDSIGEGQAIVKEVLAKHEITTVLLDENFGPEVQPGNNRFARMALNDYLSRHCALRGTVSRIGYGLDLNGPGVKQTMVYVCPQTNP